MKVTLRFWNKDGSDADKKVVVESDSIETALENCVVPFGTYTITAYVYGWPTEEYTWDKRYIGLLGL